MAYPDLHDLDLVQDNIDSKYKYQRHLDWEDLRLRADQTGDCKDFVLAKLHALIELDWPIDALKIGIVNVEPENRISNLTHAILVVSDHYVLDQRQSPVCTIEELQRIGYEPIEIQQVGGSQTFVSWVWN